jgi:hypothetical protein
MVRVSILVHSRGNPGHKKGLFPLKKTSTNAADHPITGNVQTVQNRGGVARISIAERQVTKIPGHQARSAAGGASRVA